MKISFFSEGNFVGKLQRSSTMLRVPESWYVALDAVHNSIGHPINESYDLGIIILPKKGIAELMKLDIIGNLRNYCNKLAIMQEGPNWYWQDYTLSEQIWYYNTLMSVDFLLAHNYSDVRYYKGLTDKSTYRMPSVMIEDSLKNIDMMTHRVGVMIGGNFCSWYGGFDSMVIANVFEEVIYAPSMGRKIIGEETLNITHLPYMTWSQWITNLNERKYAIHLMRTHAAGTFSLNCSYLGIPCIGYAGLDTQDILHPDLTVPIGDVQKARDVAYNLKFDESFYKMCSEKTRQLYEENYTEKHFIRHWNEILEKEQI